MITRISIVVAFVALFATGCMKNNSASSGSNAAADSMKAAYTSFSAAWDAGKVDEFDKYMAVNGVDHNLMMGQEPGLAGLKKFAAGLHTAFPDMKTTIEDMRVDSNILTVRFRVTGTNSGPMMMMPATNKKITDIMGIDQCRWENGKFAEHWGLFDDHAMMMQLGLLPPPGGPPTADAGMPKDQKKM